ncbi:hypothetical protein SCLCIDRAFT_1216982 [Scleroderma citrinum Foug A]|uniref:Uncharacterized protein n=1 Tax=Scleroderma citrinum Foug A TaxID=1036808 RepID=A0A0C3A669_9AGAM|nr:hypothetical protein SCLCIDRAFT_1216982 [Scleroderma citrinum Foug A]
MLDSLDSITKFHLNLSQYISRFILSGAERSSMTNLFGESIYAPIYEGTVYKT